MYKKLIFVISLIFIMSLVAQTSSGTGPTSSSDSSIKEQATGIKHTLVEDEIEKEIQRRVDAEVKKRMEKEVQKRVDAEVKKRLAKEKGKSTAPKSKIPKIKKVKSSAKLETSSEKKKNIKKKKETKTKKIIRKKKKPKSKIKKKKKNAKKAKTVKKTKKKSTGNSFKEIQYAQELHKKGNHSKARSFLNVLVKDKDKRLAEEAHYLLIKQYSDIFIPNVKRSENYNKVIDYNSHARELNKFKRKYPKSKYNKDLKNIMNKKTKAFNTLNSKLNMNLVDLKDSCTIKYKGDSTYICTFKKTFKDKKKKRHNLLIKVSGKITKYDPSGDMQDEWDTSGLLIDDNSLIEIILDGKSKMKYKNPIVHKQNPEYELRRVVEYGFSQNKTCVKEHKVENMINLASHLGDKFIVSNLEVKTHFGKMNELASMNVVYAAKPNGNFFSDRFNSKCYIEFSLDEK